MWEGEVGSTDSPEPSRQWVASSTLSLPPSCELKTLITYPWSQWRLQGLGDGTGKKKGTKNNSVKRSTRVFPCERKTSLLFFVTWLCLWQYLSLLPWLMPVLRVTPSHKGFPKENISSSFIPLSLQEVWRTPIIYCLASIPLLPSRSFLKLPFQSYHFPILIMPFGWNWPLPHSRGGS